MKWCRRIDKAKNIAKRQLEKSNWTQENSKKKPDLSFFVKNFDVSSKNKGPRSSLNIKKNLWLTLEFNQIFCNRHTFDVQQRKWSKIGKKSNYEEIHVSLNKRRLFLEKNGKKLMIYTRAWTTFIGYKN